MKWISHAVVIAILLCGCQAQGPEKSAIPSAPAKPAPAPIPSAATAPPRTVEDFIDLISQDNGTQQQAQKAVATMTPPATTSKSELARFYNARALLASRAGMQPQWLSDAKLAVSLEPSLHTKHFYNLELQAAQTYSAGPLDAIESGRSTITDAQQLKSDGGAATAYCILAQTYAGLGDIKQARHAVDLARLSYGRALITDGAASIWKDTWDAYKNLNVALVLSMEGQPYRAEAQARAALEVQLRTLKQNQDLIRKGKKPYLPLDWIIHVIAKIRFELANSLALQGRFAEAEVEFRQSLSEAIAELGSRNPHVVLGLIKFAQMLHTQGRYSEAAAVAQRTIALLERNQADARTWALIRARRTLAAALLGQGDWKAARAQYKVLEEVARDGMLEEKFFVGDSDWAQALILSGETDRANVLLEGLIKFQAAQSGAGSYDDAEARAFQGAVIALKGDAKTALTQMRSAFKVMRLVGVGNEATVPRMRRANYLVDQFLMLARALEGNSSAANSEVIEEVFLAAEFARAGKVPQVVAAAAARNRLPNPRLGELVRTEQDSYWKIRQLGNALLMQSELPPSEDSEKVVTDLKNQLEQARTEQARVKEELRNAFPAYLNLVKAPEITFAQLQTDLAEEEAMIVFFVGQSQTYVWTIPKTGPVRFESAALDHPTLEKTVSGLRRALDLGAQGLNDLPPFDVQAAYGLYEKLFAPTKAAWHYARTLIIVAHQELAQLPLSTLPSVRPSPMGKSTVLFEGYRSVHWLARDHGLTYVPSAGAFATLRESGFKATSRREFVGVGDPYFSRRQKEEAEAEKVALRSFQVRNMIVERVAPKNAVSGQSPSIRNSSGLEQVPRLPETADEIKAIASALSASMSEDVYLGERASERMVKSGILDNRRIVAFATHGLMAGELDGLNQPALALSAPEVTGDTENDGLLTMEEIMGLALHADWAVLSACNTAAGDGEGGEAMSGLARAFFYAGTRSLLATHWAVESSSAQSLTVDLFRRYSKSSNLSRSAALQQAMIQMMDHGAYVDEVTRKPIFSYAHPVFWAPFVLVGDGMK